MDFFNFRVTLLILAALGCCSQALLLGDKTYGVVGENVTFKTTIATTVGLSTVLWSFNNGQSIASVFTHVPVTNILRTNPLYTGRVSYNTTTCELQLGPLKKKDAGKYILNIVNAEGEPQSGEIELTVLEPITDVKISSSLPEAIEFNSTVVLTCTGKGSFTYKWFNGSDALTVDGTHMKLNAIGNELTITDVRRTDLRGPIFCRAENALKSGMSAPFNLTVSYGPEKIVMTQNPTDSFLKKGSNLTLTCSADSDPPAQLRWMFNGAELLQKANITLSNLDVKHSGNYSCVAYNVKTNRNVASPVVLVTVLGESKT
ncbi:carcinoembryonic antigen-related cell adhesion molecule 1-like [Pseudorasbora parva]|uniref:carcinoembryonic antigen-related cell adhesion molecule 1-like n=1 Tax=Pseudorasbora parva TaxID=51549 RepID=UPI00351F7BB8